jgi:hypothetical protein
MSRTATLGAALYETEASWAVNTTTFANRFPLIGEPDVSGLVHASMANPATVQYAGDRAAPIRMCYGGSFRVRGHLCGHGSTTAGAVTLEEHETILGNAIGKAASGGSGTTVNTAGATVTSLPVAAATGISSGALISVGAKGDGGGDGQWAATSSHSASTIGLLTALPAAPANAAVVYSAAQIYPIEDATNADAAITSTRWLIQNANIQYRCHGCFPMSVSFGGLGPGEVPYFEIEYGVSFFSYSTTTFPSTVSVDTFSPAPMAGGSLFVQARGTTTRQTYTYRSVAINIDLGIQPLLGPGGVNAEQCIVGAVRTQHTCSLEFVVDAEAATTTPTWAGRWDTNADWHILLSANGAATGKRWAFYMPSAFLDDSKPVQFNDGGINRERIRFIARTGQTTTTAVTLSSFRLGLG